MTEEERLGGLVFDLRGDLAAAKARTAALEAEVERLRGALEGLADRKLVPSHGDPVVLRDYARAALEAKK